MACDIDDAGKTVFQEYKLVNGNWEVRSPEGVLELVRPQDIKTTAVFTVEGELDDISGKGQTQAAHTLCAGVPEEHKRHLEAKGAGHYGIFSGRRWRENVYPNLRQFILDNETAKPAVMAPIAAEPEAAVNALAKATTAAVVATSAVQPSVVVQRTATSAEVTAEPVTGSTGAALPSPAPESSSPENRRRLAAVTAAPPHPHATSHRRTRK